VYSYNVVKTLELYYGYFHHNCCPFCSHCLHGNLLYCSLLYYPFLSAIWNCLMPLIVFSLISSKALIISSTVCFYFSAIVLVLVISASHMLWILAFNSPMTLMSRSCQNGVVFTSKRYTSLHNLSITKLMLLFNTWQFRLSTTKTEGFLIARAKTYSI
jgi:hypothetical protein